MTPPVSPAAVSPLPFITYAYGELSIGDAASTFLEEINGSLALITVAGIGRSGKSFLANQLLGQMDGFQVRSGMHPCTRGVWLWPTVQYVDTHTGRVGLVILDCQSVRDDEEDCLFCVAAALSAAVVFSTCGAIDEVQLELLAALFADSAPAHSPTGTPMAAGDLAHRGVADHLLGAGGLPSIPPPLLLLTLRDFSLALRDADGRPLSAKAYLESALGNHTRSQQRPTGGPMGGHTGGHTGALLRLLLPRRECIVMPRPTADERMLPQLHRLPPSTLRPKWAAAVAELRATLLDSLGGWLEGAASPFGTAGAPSKKRPTPPPTRSSDRSSDRSPSAAVASSPSVQTPPASTNPTRRWDGPTTMAAARAVVATLRSSAPAGGGVVGTPATSASACPGAQPAAVNGGGGGGGGGARPSVARAAAIAAIGADTWVQVWYLEDPSP